MRRREAGEGRGDGGRCVGGCVVGIQKGATERVLVGGRLSIQEEMGGHEDAQTWVVKSLPSTRTILILL